MSKHKQQKRWVGPIGQEVNVCVVTCPHCGRSGVAYAFSRHHFSKCKEAPSLKQFLRDAEKIEALERF